MKDPNIVQIANWLKDDFKPIRLFLYGSRANGTYRADSDFDFVMVLSEFDKKNRYDLMSSLQNRAFEKLGVDLQVWAYGEAEFNDWKDEFSSIPETVLNTGVEISLG
jgi:predicted nucleotidyltransferase